MPARATGTSHPRPYVWVNCAVSLDGRLAYAEGAPARLSSREDLLRVQRLRAEADGVLVGVGTVVKDDPSLRVHWDLLGEPPRPGPARIIVDGSGRIPERARVLDGSQTTIVGTTARARRTYPPQVQRIVAGEERVDLAELFSKLTEVGVDRLLVEGGAAILSSVLRAALFDRLTVYYAPLILGGATAPPMIGGPETRGDREAVHLELLALDRLGDGYVATYVLPGPGARRAPWDRTKPRVDSSP